MSEQQLSNGQSIDTDTGRQVVNIGAGTVSLDSGDDEIGAVELKNGTDDTRAKVGVGSGMAAGDNALAVADATLLGQAKPLAAAVMPGDYKSITNGSAVIAAANAARRALVITNMSNSAVLYLMLGATAAIISKGIPLAPAPVGGTGGQFVIDSYSGEVRGIMSVADATANNVAVAEV